MRIIGWLGALLLACLPLSTAHAGGMLARSDLDKVNQRLGGRIVDYTHNHGADRRIWSAALNQPRDLYVYLPPGFDCSQQYPVMLWLNGFMQDESSFVQDHVAENIDEQILAGKLPPFIVVAPDGSIKGKASFFSAGSFYVNSDAGNFEDYIIQDVWTFVTMHYPIRPEPEAHVLAGVSMGGFGAYNLAIKHQDMFKLVLGIFPPLNLRWVDCHGRYRGNFDPCCWGWRTELNRGREVLARFLGGVVTIRVRRVLDPLYGKGPEALAAVARENPIEMIDAYGLRPGDLDMYVAYAGRDQFNIDAQVESFLFRARQRGLCVSVGYDPKGKHDRATAKKLYPGIVRWLGPRLAPYSPTWTLDFPQVACPAP